MDELTHIIDQTASGIFGKGVTHAMLQKFEDGEIDRAFWRQIEEAGLTRVLVPEDKGGAGGSWLEAEVVLRAAGRHRVPLPVAEAIAASWLLCEAGFDLPEEGLLTWAPAYDHGEEVELERAPWAGVADHLLVWAKGDEFLLFGKPEGLDLQKNVAGEPRGSGRLAKSAALARAKVPPHLAALGPIPIGALCRSVQLSGALDGALHLSVNYAQERIQFGKPIGKFQAIQQQLAQMAGSVATSVRAAGAGCEAMERGLETARFDIAAAKIMNSAAVETASSVAHQVHAAIGITFEYGLNFYTRRLWSWRDEFGSDSWWAERLGGAAIERGGRDLWPAVTANTLRL